MKTQSKRSGFTIIEVVLVLAIAALIFLIVFLAVPALQRNQRDTQRRSDMGRFLSQLQTYASNHGGTLPATQATIAAYTNGNLSGGFAFNYLASNGSTFKDPTTGNDYTVTYVGVFPNPVPTTGTVGTINYYPNAVCTNGTLTSSPGHARSIAITTQLEGSSDLYCEANG